MGQYPLQVNKCYHGQYPLVTYHYAICMMWFTRSDFIVANCSE